MRVGVSVKGEDEGEGDPSVHLTRVVTMMNALDFAHSAVNTSVL